MASRISVNVHGNNVVNRQRLLDHLQILQPPAVLVLDSLDLAREIKRTVLPNATVIFREYGSQGDSDLHKRFNPRDWLDSHVHQAKDGVALHVLNEPGFTIDVLAWLTELVRYNATSHRIPLVIGNWSTGTPNAEQWQMAKELLLLADQHRAITIVGLHEYFGGVVTSGLYGGYPDNAGVAPGKSGGKNLISPGNWPSDVSNITRYHLGRFKFLLDYCDSIKLRYPRIILTEHGADDTSDIKAWEEKLKVNAPYLNVRGWKTLRNQWMDWWLPWSAERAYFEQLAWADRTIYQHSPVEAQCVFCWGHSSQDWEQFDIAAAPEFQKLLEAYAQPPLATLPQEAEPMPMPKPSNATDRTLVKLTGAPMGEVNVRGGPGELYRVLSIVRNGEEFHLYRTPPVSDIRGRKWFYADTLFGSGWVCEVEPDIFIPVKPAIVETLPTENHKPPVVVTPPVQESSLPAVTVVVATPKELQELIDMEQREIQRLQFQILDCQRRIEIVSAWKTRIQHVTKEEETVPV